MLELAAIWSNVLCTSSSEPYCPDYYGQYNQPILCQQAKWNSVHKFINLWDWWMFLQHLSHCGTGQYLARLTRVGIVVYKWSLLVQHSPVTAVRHFFLRWIFSLCLPTGSVPFIFLEKARASDHYEMLSCSRERWPLLHVPPFPSDNRDPPPSDSVTDTMHLLICWWPWQPWIYQLSQGTFDRVLCLCYVITQSPGKILHHGLRLLPLASLPLPTSMWQLPFQEAIYMQGAYLKWKRFVAFGSNPHWVSRMGYWVPFCFSSSPAPQGSLPDFSGNSPFSYQPTELLSSGGGVFFSSHNRLLILPFLSWDLTLVFSVFIAKPFEPMASWNLCLQSLKTLLPKHHHIYS